MGVGGRGNECQDNFYASGRFSMCPRSFQKKKKILEWIFNLGPDVFDISINILLSYQPNNQTYQGSVKISHQICHLVSDIEPDKMKGDVQVNSQFDI